MLLLWISIVFLMSLGRVEGNPCQIANDQDINICERGSIDEDQNMHNVVIRADLMKNCTCVLTINGQTINQNISIGRFGNYYSSHPGTISGCGLVILFLSNNDMIYQAYCSLYSIKRSWMVNQKIIIMSRTTHGNLEKGSGYCIEIINERLNEENGRLHLKCGLQNELSTDQSETTTDISQSSSVMMSATHDSIVLVSTDNESSSSYNSFVPFFTNNSGSSSSNTIAVRVSVGLLDLLLCLVTAIFVVFKTRKCQCHRKASTVEQPVYDLFTSDRDREDRLQYDILNTSNVGYQSDSHTLNTSNRDPVYETQLTMAQNTMTSSKLNTENKAIENQTPSDFDVYDNIDSGSDNNDNNYINV